MHFFFNFHLLPIWNNFILPSVISYFFQLYIDALVEDYSNSIANALELL